MRLADSADTQALSDWLAVNCPDMLVDPDPSPIVATEPGDRMTVTVGAKDPATVPGMLPAPATAPRRVAPHPARRGRAPRMATNGRTRGSRRSRATSTGPPGDADPDPPPPRRSSSRPPKKLGSPGRDDVSPRVSRVRGGRRQGVALEACRDFGAAAMPGLRRCRACWDQRWTTRPDELPDDREGIAVRFPERAGDWERAA